MVTLLAKKLFPLGQTVITPNAQATIHADDIQVAVARHAIGDWGECFPSDARDNDEALEKGWQIHSVYRDREGQSFWIITEADRSVTTILLPEDY